MIFLGTCFLSGEGSLNSTLPIGEIVTSLTIQNGVYDDLYISKNINIPYSNIIEDIWDRDTVLYAKFKGKLFAGNIDIETAEIDSLRIKRRQKGNFNWVYLFSISIYKDTDYTFERFDITARSNTIYEYAIIPISGGIESSYIVDEIKTMFNGLFIMEKDKYFSSVMVNNLSKTQNKPVSINSTWGRRYPFVTRNGINNYASVNVAAVFVQHSKNNCNWDFENSWQFREQLCDFLYDNYPKLLKYYDGRMYLGTVSSNAINESDKGHEFYIETTFEFTEIDNCDNGEALYNNGFIDVEEVLGTVVELNVTEERLNKLEYDLSMLKQSKADNIELTPDTKIINLTADAKSIGNKIDISKAFHEEIIAEVIGEVIL